jgi:hypothetical protein
MVLLVIQIETGPPEQRISLPLQRADHRPDATAFDQPVSVPCVPLSASSSQECIEFAGTTHDDLAALLAELARPDMRREVNHSGNHSWHLVQQVGGWDVKH